MDCLVRILSLHSCASCRAVHSCPLPTCCTTTTTATAPHPIVIYPSSKSSRLPATCLLARRVHPTTQTLPCCYPSELATTHPATHHTSTQPRTQLQCTISHHTTPSNQQPATSQYTPTSSSSLPFPPPRLPPRIFRLSTHSCSRLFCPFGSRAFPHPYPYLYRYPYPYLAKRNSESGCPALRCRDYSFDCRSSQSTSSSPFSFHLPSPGLLRLLPALGVRL